MTEKEKYEALCKMSPEQEQEFYEREQKLIPEKIASYSNWYRGCWEKDKCSCGQNMLIPQGTKGKYQCNSCAAMTEGMGY